MHSGIIIRTSPSRDDGIILAPASLRTYCVGETIGSWAFDSQAKQPMNRVGGLAQ